MSFIDNFLNTLDIQECISFTSKNEVNIFGLWKVEITDPKLLKLQAKNSYGEWCAVKHCDCDIPVFVESGRIDFDSRHSVNFEEMLEHEHSLLSFKIKLVEAVNLKICSLFDQVNIKRTHYINKRIINFINSKLENTNIERLSLLVSKLHAFFQIKFFTVKPLVEIYPYAPEKIRISTLINLSQHTNVIKLYNHFLPNHLTVAKFLHISPELLDKLEALSFSSRAAFAKLILSNIDYHARFDNDDISFFINCDYLSLRQFSLDKDNFIPWLKFFSKVSRNCRFANIHLLFREFMRIGLKGCTKNKRYIEAIFSFFQSKSFQNNSHDLNYSINYSLIVNSINWNCIYNGNVDRYVDCLDCSIDEIRKSDVFRAFKRFERTEAYYLKAGYSYGDLPSKYVNDLLVNCHILVGLECDDNMQSDVGFVLQKVGDSYLLIGSDNQPDRSYYHTIIVGDDIDMAFSSSVDIEGHFDEVLRSYVI